MPCKVSNIYGAPLLLFEIYPAYLWPLKVQMTPHSVYILLGANLGNVQENFQKTLEILSNDGLKLVSKSRVFESKSWGFESQELFLNQCVCVKTDKNPQELLQYLKEIEIRFGRKKSECSGYESRILDLDILYFDSILWNDEKLQIPHPRLHLRRFTLVPLCDIAPDFLHPALKRTNRELLELCEDDSQATVIT